MTRIAIIGGHGKVALHLSKLLASEGHTVTSFIRKPEQASDVEATGATAAMLDIENASTQDIAHALNGQEALVWSAGAGGGSAERTYAVDRDAAIRSMEASLAAGVKRYVMVSYLGAGPDHGVPEDNSFFSYAESKAEADEFLKGTALSWTILGPGSLTDGPSTGLIELNPSKDADNGTSRANVAVVAAAVLASPDTARRTIEFVDGTHTVQEALNS
ncbi:SDR family oxidoreductase [Pseudarthrobacter sp. PS3-L1]|uniref:SDR family oxidoreductase n=1 Tax=Pseudarthrobacter sp. PS3-L1 TaxID=3046207 RepID=UPI0024B8C344|nr:SDR family oxidoreductase [Pseudarthrobacter sp. PS3-L1]MDJ0321229.1 SDR family oxidoreductase [Pseudarthrobacter sp. PS3-L1]